MTVLEEIVRWSAERPAWQRDALRRLVEKGDLSATDLAELQEICEATHGLREPASFEPLVARHVPAGSRGLGGVRLHSIYHHRGVNALAEGQVLTFSPSLTVVYGDNGAGKTGYIRILKSACRARGAESILGNVVAGIAPVSPVVSIKYKIDSEESPREWSGGQSDEFVSRVSVFDSQSAAVYLTEKTDVAFRPFGLDLFDKLVRACLALRSQLEASRRTISSSVVAPLLPHIPEGTAVARLMNSITSLTNPDSARSLANLTASEEAAASLVERLLADQRANDPHKLAKQLRLRLVRARRLAGHLRRIEGQISDDAVAAALRCRRESAYMAEEARRLRAVTLAAAAVAGTGSEEWKSLWQAASRFSTEIAYRGQDFPAVGPGTRCVLCQQEYDQPAALRLEQFGAFVDSRVERELRQLASRVAEIRAQVSDLNALVPDIEEGIADIRIDAEPLGAALAECLELNRIRWQVLAVALEAEPVAELDLPRLCCRAVDVEQFSDQLEVRIKILESEVTNEQITRYEAEDREFRARRQLKANLSIVLEEIERKKRLAAYELCMNETRTQAITQKSAAVTRAVVTERLKSAFRSELDALDFKNVGVELREVGGEQGVLYHKIVLTQAPGVELARVVSEGEQRCLAVAAFLAELSTGEEPGGIVFDDPVSSLDYRWRESIARRLVQEASVRQVIVFTHDIVFLLLLKKIAEQSGIAQLDQHVRQLPKGAGVCTSELPWVALSVRKRIGYLRKEWQDADKLFRDGHIDAYEKEAKNIFGLLREAWERAVEEVLLGGVVERFRSSVQTQQITGLAGIPVEDCRQVEAAMTKCSRWLRGHDQAAAAQSQVPRPAELKADIDSLDSWVALVKKRRP